MGTEEGRLRLTCLRPMYLGGTAYGQFAFRGTLEMSLDEEEHPHTWGFMLLP